MAAYQTFPGEYSFISDNQQFLLYIGIENSSDENSFYYDEYEVCSNPEGLTELLEDEVVDSKTIVFAIFERDLKCSQRLKRYQPTLYSTFVRDHTGSILRCIQGSGIGVFPDCG